MSDFAICSKDVWWHSDLESLDNSEWHKRQESFEANFNINVFSQASSNESIRNLNKWLTQFDLPDLKIQNPLYNLWKKLHFNKNKQGEVVIHPVYEFNGPYNIYYRNISTDNLSWSIPSNNSLQIIKDLIGNQHIIDMCSGTGYWSWMFQQLSFNFTAVDINPGNEFKTDRKPLCYVDITKSSAENYLLQNDGCPNSFLFVSWPRSLEWLEHFKGNCLIWIGELDGGCTSCLGDNSIWKVDKCIKIPRWGGLRDLMVIYKR